MFIDLDIAYLTHIIAFSVVSLIMFMFTQTSFVIIID